MATKNQAFASLIVSFGVLCALSSAGVVPRVLECSDALRMLSPCKAYLEGTEDVAPSPSARCCWEVHNVVLRADTWRNRRDLCNCFKLYSVEHTVNLGRAKSLRAICRQPAFHPFDPSVPDCGRVT